mmetsp:Transcript_50880/g.164690  ORF Transcript_50880/g.164690 Transcript_50880/m.164690 type:complete len:297 (+) Transcript_50880:533-1423(+)
MPRSGRRPWALRASTSRRRASGSAGGCPRTGGQRAPTAPSVSGPWRRRCVCRSWTLAPRGSKRRLKNRSCSSRRLRTRPRTLMQSGSSRRRSWSLRRPTWCPLPLPRPTSAPSSAAPCSARRRRRRRSGRRKFRPWALQVICGACASRAPSCTPRAAATESSASSATSASPARRSAARRPAAAPRRPRQRPPWPRQQRTSPSRRTTARPWRPRPRQRPPRPWQQRRARCGRRPALFQRPGELRTHLHRELCSDRFKAKHGMAEPCVANFDPRRESAREASPPRRSVLCWLAFVGSD